MKRLIYIAFVLLVAVVGCKEDYLSTSPSTSVGEPDLLQSPDVFDAYVGGMHSYIYSAYYDHQSRGIASMNGFLDLLGDDLVNTVNGYMTQYYRWQDHRSPTGFLPEVLWDYYYTIIERANRVIELAGTVDGASEVQINTWLGEAHTIRAWAYHHLVQLFGKRFVKGEANSNPGVLLRLTNNFDPAPRSTVAEVYAQINDDISKGVDYISKGLDLRVKNRIRPAIAWGIRARIALTQDEWGAAAQFADSAIAKSDASLQSGKQLLDGFNSISASEWMWGYTQNAGQSFGYASFWANYAYNYDGYPYFSNFAINRTLLDKCGPNDVRWKWFICVDKGDWFPSDAKALHFGGRGLLDGLPAWEITGYQIKFYVADPSTSMGDQVAMRLGEMYYIKAEALARSGDETGAKEALVTVMETRDPDYSDATVASLTGDGLIEEIMRNRRVDLYREGFRFYDLKRLRILPKRLPSNDQTYLAWGQAALDKNVALVDSINARFAKMTKKDSLVAKQFQADTANNVLLNARCIARAKRFVDIREASYKLPQSLDDNLWEFVIPFTEIQNNPLCEQNPM